MCSTHLKVWLSCEAVPIVRILKRGKTVVRECIWLRRPDLLFCWLQVNFTGSKWWIQFGEVLNWRYFYFTIINLCILFQTQQRKINKAICQTYSWSKDGLKLFLFWKYLPMSTCHLNVFNMNVFQKSMWENIFLQKFQHSNIYMSKYYKVSWVLPTCLLSWEPKISPFYAIDNCTSTSWYF